MATPIVTPTVSIEEYNRLKALVARLEAKATAKQKITLKVGEKGGLSCYGLGRFPVTLYAGQWRRLIAAVPEIQAALIANKHSLVEKD